MPVKGAKGVKFVYIGQDHVNSVAVAGTFNSWNHQADFMQQTGEHCWELERRISKGRHLYKFVVNGVQWIVDPQNPNISEDGQNNSAMTVTENGEVIIRTTAISAQNPGFIYENYTAIDSPEWIRKAVIYELHLRAFHENGFTGLAQKIGYFKQLGVNVLWLMPFQQVGMQKRIGKYGDPYAVKDYYSIDPAFGTAEELKAMINEAHANGIRVIMDWVMNRGSVDHILTESHPEYFTRNENNEVYYEVPNRAYFAGLNFDHPDLRRYIKKAMSYWLTEFQFDGFRLDDSDITPSDFLTEIRDELKREGRDVVLISQAYDEYHHVDSCDLTYDGSLRSIIKDVAEGALSQKGVMEIYHSYTYSFPRGSLRMRWLEEKEQSRVVEYLGPRLAKPAATLLLTVEGVPFIMMGQEFNERTFNTWQSLFDEYRLEWTPFDQDLFDHYRFLIRLRTEHAAFWDGELIFIENEEDKVLSYIRKSKDEEFLVIVSFSEAPLVLRFEEKSIAERIAGAAREVVYRSGYFNPGDKHPPDWRIQPYESLIYRIH
ncbi:glycosidase [Paenibacillus phyllosphaerae]|uniref:Glycosidase n=1 Tax=Paenibacillus phyllosphaerae TaxID=274593 RepID=A0A7W5B5I1_9BACL|nr:alpha-amylase family glycosyl hydrolase [Paenibacillus phyllosphaerae]MBB3114780.1 glycosidase [Paenibacillus phyllosphaerae]